MKYLIGIIIFLLFLVLGMQIRDLFFYEPKFKVNDCIDRLIVGNEFKKPELLGIPVKILEVGKEYYKTTVQFKRLYSEKQFDTFYIRSTDKDYISIDCEGL